MVGNLINNSVLTPGQSGQAAAFVLIVLIVSHHPDAALRPGDPRPTERWHERSGLSARTAWWRDPWRKPRLLARSPSATSCWSLLPVLIAVLFSFNAGRSRTNWQGFSLRWYWGDPRALGAGTTRPCTPR